MGFRKRRTGLGANLSTQTSAEISVKPLIDFNKLLDLAFRREALDWRDNFHADVTITVSLLQDKFIQRMQAKFDNTSWFRLLVTQPSSEILQDSFDRIVRLPFISALRKEEAKLNESAEKWALFGKVDLVLTFAD